MINKIIEELYPLEYSIIEIHNSNFIPLYFNIEDRYIFVPYEMNSSDLTKFKKIEQFQTLKPGEYKAFVEYITNEVAVCIQSKLPRHSNLKYDIYLLITINTKEFPIKHEEILKIENDRFCCRKIIFTYDLDIENEETENQHNNNMLRQLEDLKRQFKIKLMFNKVIEEFEIGSNCGSEEHDVKIIISNEDDKTEFIKLEEYTFLELQNNLIKIYKRYGIE